MKAKNLMVTVLAVLSITMFNACSPSETIIKAAVAGTNMVCPVELRDGVSITGAEYTGEYLVYSVYCDAEQYDVNSDFFTETTKEELIEKVKEKMAESNNDSRLKDALMENEIGLIVRFYNETGSSDLVLEAEDLLRLFE